MSAAGIPSPRVVPPPPRPAVFERRFGLGLAGLTLFALVLRCIRLGAQSLWIDEVLSYGWIAEIHAHGLRSLLTDIHGPLQALAIWATSHVSTSESWLRLPSAIAGTLAVPALGLLGRALWGAEIGLTAAALLAVSPFALYYSQECRDYAFSILFAIVTLHAAIACVRRTDVKRGAVLVLAELASVFSNLNGIFFLMGVGLWGVAVLRARRGALAGWVAAHAVVALLLVPYGWEITHQVRPERLVGVETPGFGAAERLRGQTTLHPLALPYTAYAFAVGYSLGPTLEELRADPAAAVRPRHLPFLILTALAFGVPLVVGLWRCDARTRGLLVAPAVTTLGLVVWLAAANMKPYNVRYLTVLLPAFLLAIAAGLWRLPRRWRRAAGGLTIALSLVSCCNDLFVPRYARDDVRGAVRYVAEHAAAGDVVLQISLTGCMRYYYDALGSRPIHPPATATASPEAARAYLAPLVQAAPTVWYLECRPQAIDPGGVIRKTLQSLATGETVIPFVGIRVHRFAMAPG